MKFLLYGQNGWIGQLIAQSICSAVDEVFNGCRVSVFRQVLQDLERFNPDRVICALGRTNGRDINSSDYLESEGAMLENVTDNLVAPLLIGQAALLSGNRNVLYIGSGCIFEYDTAHLNTPFVEDDHPNFFGSSYSIVKGQTDEICRGLENMLCARIRLPITDSPSKREFITKICGYRRIVSIPNSMTVLPDVLRVLLACIEYGKTGIYNAVNPGCINHQSLHEFYRHLTGIDTRYELTTETEMKSFVASRRSNQFMSSAFIEEETMSLPLRLKTKYYIPEDGRALVPVDRRVIEILKFRRLAGDVGLNRVRKVILVTGGAGFIGSNWINFWMSKHPQDRIVSIDCLSQVSSIKNVKNTNSCSYRFVKGNLLDSAMLAELFIVEEFTHVLHFAALSHVDRSFAKPFECLLWNVAATHTLLEVVRLYGRLLLFVHISTDEVYGEIQCGLFDEQSGYTPTNPYSASKAGSECLVKAYGRAHKLPYIITRANNVYGPFQFPLNVIPCFLENIRKYQRMPVHGQGKSLRRFLHILDKCRALEILLEKGEIGEVYNIGSLEETTVLQLCQRLLNIHHKGASLDDWVDFVPDRAHNDCRYAVDTRKLESLGWKPEVAFHEGLCATKEWYMANPCHWKSCC